MADDIDIIAVSDGRAGNARQSEALARAIGGRVRELHVMPEPPWRWFAPRCFPGSDAHVRRLVGSLIDGPAPDLLVGCGRQAAFGLRVLKRRWPDVFTVQILDPRMHRDAFDVLVCPEHDRVSGHNVVVSLTAMHDIDDTWLATARRDFPEFQALPRPITTVLIGGASPMLALDAASLGHLFAHIDHMPQQHQGSLLLTTSRRTPKSVEEMIGPLLSPYRHVRFRAGDSGVNPYPGFLAAADRIVVTPDSVNMISEAVAIGVPVFTLTERAPTGKIASFHQAMTTRGLLHPLGQIAWPRPPLRETPVIAARIRERFAERR